MHFPTPHIKKSAKKRKQSLDSIAATDDESPAAVDKKTAMSKKKAKTTRAPKEKKVKKGTTEDTHAQYSRSSPTSSRSSSLSAPSLPTMSRADSALDIPPVPITTTTTSHTSHTPTSPTSPNALRQTRTAPAEHTQPRRSSRIKNSLHSVANTWTKARPYIERINGTIMPLEHQGLKTAAYYERDGVRVD